MKLFKREPAASTVSDTLRMEIYSDAVFAIIITLLVLELRVPHLADMSIAGVLNALKGMAPNLLAFAFSFLTLTVFWVNHHHFYHELSRTDGRLLWYNSFLLFWLAFVPFTTAFLAENPWVPGVLMVYCFTLFMAALSFVLMVRHALFVGCLLHAHITDREKATHFRRTLIGVSLYGLGTVAAPFLPAVSALAMVVVPLYYLSPRMIHDHNDH